MTAEGYALLGLTAMVAALVGVLTFAALRFAAAARHSHRQANVSGGETALLSAALADAVAKMKSQEAAMTARAAASERLSRLIVESLTAGLVVVDGTGRVEMTNPAARRVLSLGEDPVGADYHALLSGAPSLRDLIAECLSTGQPILRREAQLHGAGSSLHLGVTVSPYGSATEPGAICLFTDLTSVVEREEQLRLKEALARLGELTAGIAHEFRNGLATIHGYSRLLDPSALPEKYQPYVAGIRQETETLGQIVTNFLNFARPERISFAQVPLGRLARRASDDLAMELPIGTSVDVMGEFGDIQGDEVLLRQVFGNLVRNAAEACSAHGTQPHIRITGAIDSARGVCRISVADNGPGIAEADRERVFQPFFTTRARGTGLGLAVVQKIVVMHNGRVLVGGSPAGGADIELTFPLASGS